MSCAGPLSVCHLDTERPWRGGEQQLLYLARGLRESGARNLIAARAGSALAAKASAEGFEVLALRPLMEWDPMCALALRRQLLARRCGILHAHTGHAVGLGALATLGTGVPMVASRRVDFHLSRSPLTRWKYRRAAAILAVSGAIREVLLADGLPPDRVEVVYSGIEPARETGPGPSAEREAVGLPAAGRLIGQIAALAPHKDPLNFVRAMAALRQERPDAVGVLVGDGPLAAMVRGEIARLGLEGAVLPIGFREDARSLLRHFEVFVLSSRLEGLGTSILDAMAAGVPVVATRAGGIPEMVEDGVSGLLVPARDPRALASAVGRVLADQALRERLRRGGLEAARRFSAAAMVAATRAVYARILEPGTRADSSQSASTSARK